MLHSIDLNFSPCIFTIKYFITFFYYHLFIFCTFTYGNYFTFQWFFFCCIGGDYNSANCFFSSAAAGFTSTLSANGLMFILLKLMLIKLLLLSNCYYLIDKTSTITKLRLNTNSVITATKSETEQNPTFDII